MSNRHHFAPIGDSLYCADVQGVNDDAVCGETEFAEVHLSDDIIDDRRVPFEDTRTPAATPESALAAAREIEAEIEPRGGMSELAARERAIKLTVAECPDVDETALRAVVKGIIEPAIAAERAAVVAYIEQMIESNDAMSWDDALDELKADLQAGKHLPTEQDTK